MGRNSSPSRHATEAFRLAADPEAWKRHACLVAGRKLTRREWKDALPDRAYRPVCSD
jgi:hypothetical protein